ncbi:glutaredoxin family protein [Labedella endophytica]|uniref:Glutaredoxin family protein n=1 Tax=Labedella endophytica TaxID=1523160 RepID=A0A3S0Y2P9_9MICO|nr:glutaredoxin family protein [Labedella endophytica]RUR03347.1 glutaredoxin family protein [Labedella endophytica]
MTVAITLIGKPDCHLCDDARAVVDGVLTDLRGRGETADTTLEELSITDDESLRERYWEMIPVVLVNGRQHCYWRVDADRLTNAILSTTPLEDR